MRLLLFVAALLFVTVSGAKAQDQATVVAACGAAHLTAGTQAFRTVDTNGVTCSNGSGGGATGCSQATAYLARAPGETTHAADLTALICGLVTDGVWGQLDALYVLAQQTAADALLNLVGTSYTATNTGVPFVAYQGFGPFGGGYLNTNFNAATAPSPQFTQNNASFGAWLGTFDAASSAAVFGNSATGATGESHIYPDNGGQFYVRLNNPAASGVPDPATTGLYVGDRPSSTTVTPYFNGAVSTGPAASTSQPVFNGVFTIGLVATAGTDEVIAEAHIGASLGSAGNLALYTRLRTYMTAVGVP